MPLTSKGEKILSNMKKEYGSDKKGKQVFYASRNAGKISGVDKTKKKKGKSESMKAVSSY